MRGELFFGVQKVKFWRRSIYFAFGSARSDKCVMFETRAARRELRIDFEELKGSAQGA